MDVSTAAPLATGYLAPVHGRAGITLVVLGLFAVIVLLGGILAPSVGLALLGAGGLALAGGGYALYWRSARQWPMVFLYPDRLEFVRGPQGGTVVQFAEVAAARTMHWGRSPFGLTGSNVTLVLETPRGEWQLSVDIAESERFRTLVLAALRDFRS